VQRDERHQRLSRDGERVPGGRIHLMLGAELAGKAVQLACQYLRRAMTREVGRRIVATR
jgi:hypothetical protein